MPSQSLVDVRIIVDGRPLKEYCDPDSDLDDENLRTRYVEVKAGQEFAVRVKLLQGFELRSAKYVESVFQIDNHRDVRPCYFDAAADMQLDHQNGGGTLLTDRAVTHGWDSQTDWNEDYGEWTELKWTFGALGYSETSCNLE